MTTIEDHTLTESAPPAAKANGTHATATRVRAPKAIPASSGDAIVDLHAARTRLERELETNMARNRVILEALGRPTSNIDGKLVRSTKAGTGKAIQLNDDMAPIRTRKRSTSEDMQASRDAILTFLKDVSNGEPVSASAIIEGTDLDTTVVRRELLKLKKDEAIVVTGKNRGAKYAVK